MSFSDRFDYSVKLLKIKSTRRHRTPKQKKLCCEDSFLLLVLFCPQTISCPASYYQIDFSPWSLPGRQALVMANMSSLPTGCCAVQEWAGCLQWSWRNQLWLQHLIADWMIGFMSIHAATWTEGILLQPYMTLK